MYNWSTDTTKLKKTPAKYTKWKLEQMINYGLDGEKLKETELRKHFPSLNIDPDKRAFLKRILSL
ncbi:hypothetical protein COT50_00375 [candidate division WWE3 bacterium CG08_land_8_20_14_0_20_41_10]|uniref:Uncharacterized protein n=1 Tax=candidate division WWE3 bacterium CG08_land_8_20_14_0_20_41_10 TaxID=1975085 RepID=A0A2H0XCZ7_UNCKA|nr:MAG: hypothetical protein COT50_00375 [candidate division WWE3 bacterium CG08_land_8_20_14_0_20_41_10]